MQEGKTLTEQIQDDERFAKLKKQIEELERKCRAEKQPRKRFELYERIKKLKRELPYEPCFIKYGNSNTEEWG